MQFIRPPNWEYVNLVGEELPLAFTYLMSAAEADEDTDFLQGSAASHDGLQAPFLHGNVLFVLMNGCIC